MTELAVLPSGRPQRLVYFGTPDMAVPPLEALVADGFDVALVITRIDKRRGRGSDVAPSPVKAAALRLELPVSHLVDDALLVGADLGVVVAFGQLITAHVLERLPMVNLHFSLLPRWRGAAPVERALLAGDATTGVCLMQLAEGLDTGPLLDVVEVPIGTTRVRPSCVLRWCRSARPNSYENSQPASGRRYRSRARLYTPPSCGPRSSSSTGTAMRSKSIASSDSGWRTPPSGASG